MCEEKNLLVSYLYEDLTEADRAGFERHLRGCADCRDELTGLRGVRADLTSWAPPASELGFRIVRDPKVVELKPRGAASTEPGRGAWRGWYTPAAGLAAAAVLVLAAASAVAHVEIRRGPDGITVRTGWNTAAAQTTAALPAPVAPALREASVTTTPPADAAKLAAIEARLHALESSHDSGVRAAAMLSARSSDEELLHRVRDMLTVSEGRQTGELALRVSQLGREFDAQRTVDMQKIQNIFARMNASVDADASLHREWASYMLSNSTKQK
jgi:hypothetical protein